MHVYHRPISLKIKLALMVTVMCSMSYEKIPSMKVVKHYWELLRSEGHFLRNEVTSELTWFGGTDYRQQGSQVHHSNISGANWFCKTVNLPRRILNGQFVRCFGYLLGLLKERCDRGELRRYLSVNISSSRCCLFQIHIIHVTRHYGTVIHIREHLQLVVTVLYLGARGDQGGSVSDSTACCM